MSLPEQTQNPAAQTFAALMEHGLSGCSDQAALETLLLFALPPGKAHELSCRLIRRFGSLSGVMDANVYALGDEEGMNDRLIILVKLIPQLRRKAMLCERERAETTAGGKRRSVVIRTTEEAAAYLAPVFYGYETEVAYALLLNDKNEIVKCQMAGQGRETSVHIDIRHLTSSALAHAAAKLYLAHNHPRGNPQPSRRDCELTRTLSADLARVNVELIDHIIFSDGGTVSLKEYMNRL